MEYTFSDRISSLKPSAIREIFKVLGDKSVISFAGGNPAPETFPAQEMETAIRGILERQPASALQYGITEGEPRLRELTEKRLREKFDLVRPGDETIIVTGGQQGINLTTKVLTNEGDVVICEEPSFIGALNAFRSYNTKLVGVPVDREGMDLGLLEDALKKNKNAKFLYIISTFQNPSGITTSLERRKAILELAEKYNVMILEDNPYFELRYSGEYVPPLKHLDPYGRVIYVGSYSKVISPGIRLGFVCGPAPVVGKMVVAKQVQDVHSNQLCMMLVADYLEHNDFDAHIERSRELYHHKRDRMLRAMDAHLAGLLTWNVPDGGIFLWAELPKGTDGAPLVRMLSENKVAVVPGAAFLTDESAPSNAFRLNFSLPSDQQIDDGIAIMGRCVREFLK